MAKKPEVSAVVLNLDKIIAALQARSLKGKKRLELEVGYSAPHAVYVHEDLSANHPNGGQAKYLEQPARQMRNRMAGIIRRSVLAKNGLEEGMIRAGQALLAASRPLVPVDTGELRDSGFVRVVGGSDVVNTEEKKT